MSKRTPSFVPREGWTSASFRGRRGRALIRAWLANQRQFKAKAMKEMKVTLLTLHRAWFDDVLRIAEQRHRQKAASSVTIDPMGDQSIWASVLESEIERLNLDISVQLTPIYENTVAGVYEANTVLLGKQPTERQMGSARRAGRRLAQRVTRISQTTKNRMERAIRQGIDDDLTIAELVPFLRDKFPTISSNRFPTIARTEMGRAADAGTMKSIKEAETVLEVSVIGCEAVEPGIPTFDGRPTCNIQAVPARRVDELEFHINHTGTIIPSKFVDDAGDHRGDGPEEEKEDQEPHEQVSDEISNFSFPDTLDDLVEVESLGGSTGARLMEHKVTGHQYVMKRGAGPEHLMEEVLADSLYQAAGLDVPEYVVIMDGKTPVKLSRFIEGKLLKDLPKRERDKAIAQLRKGFAVDAFLGNWDVAGTGMDNILVDSDGKVWRIDNGGSLRFRAQGARKGEGQFAAFSEELWSMRERGAGAEVFGGMDWGAIATSIEETDFEAMIERIPNAEKELKEMLTEKAKQYRHAASFARSYQAGGFKDWYINQNTRFGHLIRAEGLENIAPTKLTHTHDRWGQTFNSADGRKWGGWRGGSSQGVSDEFIIAQDDPYLDLKSKIEKIIWLSDSEAKAMNKADVELALDDIFDIKDAAPKEIKEHYTSWFDWLEDAHDAIIEDEWGEWKEGHPPPSTAGENRFVEAIELPPDDNPLDIVRAAAKKIFGDDYRHAEHIAYRWKKGHGSSALNDHALGNAYFMMEEASEMGWEHEKVRQPRKKEFVQHFFQQLSTGPSFVEDTPHEELAKKALGFDHQVVQEFLAHTEFPGNDQERKLTRIVRTESGRVIPEGTKDRTVIKDAWRGPNLSGSIAKSTYLNDTKVTTQAVPHSRVTGIYIIPNGWDEKRTGSGFLSDSENEFSFMGPGLDYYYHGDGTDLGRELDEKYKDIGTDATKWGIPLDALNDAQKEGKKNLIAPAP